MTPMVKHIATMKAAYEGLCGGKATIVELSPELHNRLAREVEPHLTHKNENSDGNSYVMGLKIVKVPGTNKVEIK